jgi:hypothetical protein
MLSNECARAAALHQPTPAIRGPEASRSKIFEGMERSRGLMETRNPQTFGARR